MQAQNLLEINAEGEGEWYPVVFGAYLYGTLEGANGQILK